MTHHLPGCQQRRRSLHPDYSAAVSTRFARLYLTFVKRPVASFRFFTTPIFIAPPHSAHLTPHTPHVTLRDSLGSHLSVRLPTPHLALQATCPPLQEQLHHPPFKGKEHPSRQFSLQHHPPSLQHHIPRLPFCSPALMQSIVSLAKKLSHTSGTAVFWSCELNPKLNPKPWFVFQC